MDAETERVSGRVPALPEDIREDEIERVFDFLHERGVWLVFKADPDDPICHGGSNEELLIERYAETGAAGEVVPGLVQRLTEAEELLRGVEITVRQRAAAPWGLTVSGRIDAFLSVGEGRSREPDGDAE